MQHRHDEETITRIRQSSKRIIPRQERPKQTEKPTRLANCRVGHTVGIAVHVCDAEQKDRQVDDEEKEKEGKGGFQRAHHHKRGEDEPAL